MSLVSNGRGLWTVSAPLRVLGLIELNTRMTVATLGDGLLVHSPVAMTPTLRKEIDALGKVRFIVAPNMYHHLYAGDAVAAWPEAKLLAPAALTRKRKDLRADIDLDAGVPDSWAGYVDAFPIRGSMLGETVFHHRESRTLISSDLFENFTHSDDRLTRAYLKLGGIYGKPGWHRMLRLIYRDRKAARASLAPILDLDLARIIVAHGDIVEQAPIDAMRSALAFLL